MTLSALAAQRLGMTPDQGADDVLKRAARARNIPVSELEGLEAQMRLLDSIPERLQLTFMRDTLSYMDRVGTLLRPMQTAWYGGDVDALVRIMNESMANTPELYDIMLSNRNRAWAQWIDTRMERPGTVFIAVGAGHLAGRNSVQDYLREHGHRTERVPAG
jgi:uncharacterized protein YbaP (TraB family)